MKLHEAKLLKLHSISFRARDLRPRLQAEATAMGLSLSSYIRYLIVTHPKRVSPETKEAK
jgi:hypothetical protein